MEPQDSDEGVLIDARDLRYSYGIGEIRNEVLHGVGAQVRAGEIVMVTGPSGSGKTTFLTLIGGLRQIQEGYLRVLGTDLSTASEEERCRVRQQFGFIFQSHNLVESLTSLQNVPSTIIVDRDGKVAWRALRGVDYDELAAALDTVVAPK